MQSLGEQDRLPNSVGHLTAGVIVYKYQRNLGWCH